MPAPVIDPHGRDVRAQEPYGLRVTYVRLYYPDTPSGGLVAYGTMRIEDHTGLGFYLTNLRLLRLESESSFRWIVAMPNEPKRVSCPKCSGKNQGKARFCNWCGIKLSASDQNQFVDMLSPLNDETRSMILEALLQEHASIQCRKNSE